MLDKVLNMQFHLTVFQELVSGQSMTAMVADRTADSVSLVVQIFHAHQAVALPPLIPSLRLLSMLQMAMIGMIPQTSMDGPFHTTWSSLVMELSLPSTAPLLVRAFAQAKILLESAMLASLLITLTRVAPMVAATLHAVSSHTLTGETHTDLIALSLRQLISTAVLVLTSNQTLATLVLMTT